MASVIKSRNLKVQYETTNPETAKVTTRTASYTGVRAAAEDAALYTAYETIGALSASAPSACLLVETKQILSA